jgi:Family of unknown function (DUF6445)
MTRRGAMIDRDWLAINAREDMSIEFVEVAGRAGVVIDNVYRDPDCVRGLALSLNYHREAGAYPGYFAFVSISSRPLLDLINELLHEAIGHELGFTPFYKDDLAFAVVTKRGDELVPGQRKPHFDDFCDYACLVYLNPPDQCAGGTSFWRHRRTGLELARGAPQAPLLLARYGVADEVELAKRLRSEKVSDGPTGYLTESNSIWELTHAIDMKYNRLICYSSDIFHSPLYDDRDFGGELETQRLTQNLYFNKVRTEA